ncbi:unnamed protein product [Clonostachys byssicola]|uniref:Arrestin-like N-terminal domain-containing protein n=1 Tax=Clonostachys byssicola TaxID=160290 RepID=A0A9N9U7P4_9HYPO|nr:unnamed protein product [Clonostachys byssicola]
MPTTKIDVGPKLDIFLATSPPHRYVATDTIFGEVQRIQHLVSADTQVTIKLRGRAKTKITTKVDVSYVNFNVWNRDRDDIIEIEQTIYSGPVHIPEDSQDAQGWPFSIEIPQVYTSAAGVTALLPNSFNVFHKDDKGKVEAFIEYALFAELTATVNGSLKKFEATLPIHIRQLTPILTTLDTSDILDKGHVVKSRQLIPGSGDAERSTSKKLKNLFKSSPTPSFAFDIQVTLPNIIQLEGPNPFPLKVRVIPDWSKTSQEIVNVPQKMTLTWVSANIVSLTDATPDKIIRDVEQRSNFKIWEMARALGKTNIEMPWSKVPADVDIGELINLRFGADRVVPSVKRPNGLPMIVPCEFPLFPDHETNNIKHANFLEWEIIGRIGGEKFTTKGVRPVSVVCLGEKDAYQPRPITRERRH